MGVEKFPEIGQLNRIEVGTILNWLAEEIPPEEIVSDFEILFGRQVALGMVLQIREKYTATQLAEFKKRYLKMVERCPGAKRSTRLQILMWIVNRARKDRAQFIAVKSGQCDGDPTYETWWQPNYKLVMDATKAMEMIQNNAARIELEWAKLDQRGRHLESPDPNEFLDDDDDEEAAV